MALRPNLFHILFALVAAMGTGLSTGCSDPPPSGLPATVVEAVDGDTVDVRFGDGHTDRVRLLGIDTPETVDPDRPVGCFGPEASGHTKSLLPAGTQVLLQRDVEARDRYGRLLVYMWRRRDSLFVNESLVRDGFARTLSIAPNTAHRVDLSEAAALARQERDGLWSACHADGRDP